MASIPDFDALGERYTGLRLGRSSADPVATLAAELTGPERVIEGPRRLVTLTEAC